MLEPGFSGAPSCHSHSSTLRLVTPSSRGPAQSQDLLGAPEDPGKHPQAEGRPSPSQLFVQSLLPPGGDSDKTLPLVSEFRGGSGVVGDQRGQEKKHQLWSQAKLDFSFYLVTDKLCCLIHVIHTLFTLSELQHLHL